MTSRLTLFRDGKNMLTFSEQILDALCYMGHPFLLLCAGSSINSKRLCYRFNEPPVSKLYKQRQFNGTNECGRSNPKSYHVTNDEKLNAGKKKQRNLGSARWNVRLAAIYIYAVTQNYLRPSSAKDSSFTSSSGIMCCLLYYFVQDQITRMLFSQVYTNPANIYCCFLCTKLWSVASTHLFLVDHYVTVNKNIIEKKKLTRLRLFSTHLS